MGRLKNKECRITKSIWGHYWKVEENIGGTLYYTHHVFKKDAIEYARNNGLIIVE